MSHQVSVDHSLSSLMVALKLAWALESSAVFPPSRFLTNIWFSESEVSSSICILFYFLFFYKHRIKSARNLHFNSTFGILVQVSLYLTLRNTDLIYLCVLRCTSSFTKESPETRRRWGREPIGTQPSSPASFASFFVPPLMLSLYISRARCFLVKWMNLKAFFLLSQSYSLVVKLRDAYENCMRSVLW